MAYLPISLLDEANKPNESDLIEVSRYDAETHRYNSYKLPLSSIVDINDDVLVEEEQEVDDDTLAHVNKYKEYFITTSNYTLLAFGQKTFNAISADSLSAYTGIFQNGLTSNNLLFVDGNATIEGNVKCTLLDGIALSACWADLAEIYEADYEYAPGTLVKFGGDAEITIADDVVNAVVSTEPGLLLNSYNTGKHPTKIALVGKVPVLVKGKLAKFDKIKLSKEQAGIAEKADVDEASDNIIGIALKDKPIDDVSCVLCATRFKL